MQVGKAFGVVIRLDKFFLLLLFVYSFFGLLPQVVTVFAVVFVHEVAHVLVAKSYGYRVKEIELLPFGGVARIEDLDLVALDPDIEVNIALAGPLQNLLLAGVGVALRYMGWWQEPLATFFINCNLGMMALNMLPVLPLDGGRIYRAYLVRRVGFRRATEQVATWGRVVGLLLSGVGLIGLYLAVLDITILLVALFIFLAASRERLAAAYIFMRFLTRKQEDLREKGILPVEALMATESTTLREIARRLIPKRYHLVMVEGEDHIPSFFTEGEIVRALLETGLETTLREVRANRQ